ncbi:hypothetical protein QTH90_31420 [Variovorax sp. J2P1-59]|uniref:hypothetical protein n=1 Tax=Variovorax flavidus TaxID=3053501 RepID=UPI002577741C|nr:hypothetical protein [Variovorax sp. J2P1-59]MDM0078951.1 hypothetical protein [Variovorax sp. J2P1-59]
MSSDFNHVAAAILAFCLATQTAIAGEDIPNCLYSFTVGPEPAPVEPCGADTKHIGMDPHVLAVMRTFNIPTTAVIFKSCPGGRFLARPDSTDGTRFIVQYPSAAKSNYLAPIVHELAHVLQMRDAGSLEALNPKKNSHRIELGADFLSGLAFNSSLMQVKDKDFETNLELAGSYKVEVDDHGPPEHRSAAFRRGLVRKEPFSELTIIQSLKYWYANDYQTLSR